MKPYESTHTAKSRNDFLGYIQTYRAIAAIFVIAVHCPWLLSDAHETSFTAIIFNRSTQLFIFLSGFVFQHLSNKFNWRAYYVSKFKNVIIPYFIISLPILLYRLFISKTIPDIEVFLVQLISGGALVPMWFIPTILLFYTIGPLLIKLDRNGFIYYLLPLFIALSLVVTRDKVVNNNQLVLFTHFFSVYLLGMLCSKHKEQLYDLTDKYNLLLVFVTVLLVIIQYVHPLLFTEQLQFIQKTLLSFLFLYWFRKYDDYVPKTVKSLADISFGIYLIHYLALSIIYFTLKCVTGKTCFDNTPLHYALLIAAVLVLTVMVIKIIKLSTKKYSRYLVGC
jgi:surface polysaccharide O-acyltransferase-like enzyme